MYLAGAGGTGVAGLKVMKLGITSADDADTCSGIGKLRGDTLE